MTKNSQINYIKIMQRNVKQITNPCSHSYECVN